MKNFLFITIFTLIYSCLSGQERAPIKPLKYTEYSYLQNKVEEPKFTNPYLKIAIGEMSFFGDISNKAKPFSGRTSYKIGVSSKFNQNYMLSLYLSNGIINQSGFTNTLPPNEINLKSEINAIGISIEKDLLQNKDFTPTFLIGLEMINYKSKIDADYDNKYETHLSKENAVSIPIGFGLKYQLNKRFIFNMNGNYHLTNTDNIDGEVFLENNDSYITIEAGLNYDLFCVSCKKINKETNTKIFENINLNEYDNGDEDNDGVKNIDDYCLKTGKGITVYPEDHKFAGCPIDSDNDGIPDHIDQEKGTPLGAVVNSLGVQMTDEISEQIYLNYINTESKFKSKMYYREVYPSKEYLDNIKNALNTETKINLPYSDLFSRLIIRGEEFKAFEKLANYKIENSINKVFKLKLFKKDSLSAKEANNLLSMRDLISTYENNNISYFTGDYSSIFSTEKNQDLKSKQYSNTQITKDNQGDLKYLNEQEINAIKIEKMNANKEILYRVFIFELDSIMSDSLQKNLERYNIITIPTGSSNKYYSRDFDNYKEAVLLRNDFLTLGYEESKILAFKNGRQIELNKVLPKGIEKINFDYEEINITFEILLGIYASDEYDNKLDKIFSINDVKSEEIDESGTTRYTSGNFSSFEKAVNYKNNLENQGLKNISIIFFLNQKQISIKKAKELLGL